MAQAPAPAPTKFFTYKAQAPAGAPIGFKAGHGYYILPGPKTSAHAARAATPPSLYATALKLAQQSEQPNIDAITASKTQADNDAATQRTNQQGFTAALAQLLGGEGPAVSKAYDNAAGATAGFAKGLSDAEAHIADNENASLTDFLTKQGLTPDQIHAATSKIGGGAASDVTYGLGGYVPASNLEREGAAFSAAADKAPEYATGVGAQALAQMAKAATDQDTNFDTQLASERGKIPGVAQSLLNDMLTRQQQQESIDIQRQYLGNTKRSTDASITGVDPVTGQPTAKAQAAQASAAAKVASAKGKAGKARETAFAEAQQHVFNDAKGLSKPMTTDDKIAWLVSHPGKTLADAPSSHAPAYAVAAKQLFDKYKFLLRYASRSGQPALKKRLNAIIADALAAQGIHPPAPPTKTQKAAKQVVSGAFGSVGPKLDIGF